MLVEKEESWKSNSKKLFKVKGIPKNMGNIEDYVNAVEESILKNLNVHKEARNIALALKRVFDNGHVEIIDIDRQNLKEGEIPSRAYEYTWGSLFGAGRETEMVDMGLLGKCYFWDSFSSGRQGGAGYWKYFLTDKAIELVDLLEKSGYYQSDS